MQKIYRVAFYESETGVTVKELTNKDASEDKFYLSADVVELAVQSPYGEIKQPVQFQFKIDADNIKDAYDKWEEASSKAKEDIKKEHEQKIVTASPNNPKLFVP